MSSSFAITVATNSVLLDSSRQGQIAFTASTTARAIRGRARLVAQPASAAAWLTLVGEPERDFVRASSQQYTVQIAVPASAPAGDYTFRLDMIDLANPDEDLSEGPTVKFSVEQPVPVKKPFPWWIVAVAVGVLIVLSAGIYGLTRVSQKSGTVATPTAAVATPTATARRVALQWQTLPSLLTPRTDLAVVRGQDGRFYAFGGFSGRYLNTMEIYDPQTRRWSPGPIMPVARGGLGAAVGLDGRIYLFGGGSRSGDSGIYQISEVDIYNPSQNSWSVGASMANPRRDLVAVTGPDGRIYVFGGSIVGSAVNEVDIYNPQDNSWSAGAAMPHLRTSFSAVLAPNGRIYVFGGGSATVVTSVVDVYDPALNSWSSAAPMPTPREGAASALGPDGKIYVIGGFSQSKFLTTVEGYNPTTNSWTTGTPLPTTRYQLAAVQGSDKRVYAIGGSLNGDPHDVDAYGAP